MPISYFDEARNRLIKATVIELQWRVAYQFLFPVIESNE